MPPPETDFMGLLAGDANGFGMSLYGMHHSGSSWGTCPSDSPGCPVKLLLLLQGYQMTRTFLYLQKGGKMGGLLKHLSQSYVTITKEAENSSQFSKINFKEPVKLAKRGEGSWIRRLLLSTK